MLQNTRSITAVALLGACAALSMTKAHASANRPVPQTDYVRIVGGAGYGYCEMTRHGRRVSVNLHAIGMGPGDIGTGWIFVDGVNVGRLDGAAATDGGDIFLSGSFNAPRGAEVKIDVRNHRVSMRSIGNQPNDPAADDALVKELTTPAPYRMGTCATRFTMS